MANVNAYMTTNGYGNQPASNWYMNVMEEPEIIKSVDDFKKSIAKSIDEGGTATAFMTARGYVDTQQINARPKADGDYETGQEAAERFVTETFATEGSASLSRKCIAEQHMLVSADLKNSGWKQCTTELREEMSKPS